MSHTTDLTHGSLLVISGGQTGADMGGLLGAVDAGFKTGGWAPKGYLTEVGPVRELAGFGLREAGPGWLDRTNRNAAWGEVTLWFGRAGSPGGRATKRACEQAGRPFIEVEGWPASKIAALLLVTNISVVNIAGNRESGNHGLQARVRETVGAALRIYAGGAA